MKKQMEMLKEFERGLGREIPKCPETTDKDTHKMRSNLLLEESNEFANAIFMEEKVDGLIDVIYIALGGLVELGVDPEPIFEIVHKANMSKLSEKRFNDDGKLLKPESFVSPNISIRKEIGRQIQQSHTIKEKELMARIMTLSDSKGQ